MNKKKKTLLMLAVVVLLVTALSLTLVGCKKAIPSQSDSIPLKVDMADQYYVGTNGAIDLTKIFGTTTCSIKSGTSGKIEGNTLTIAGTDKFEMTVGSATKKVTVIDGAYNVSDYPAFADKAKAGEKVVVQATDFAMTKEVGTISVKNDIYGNGVNIDANAVSKATGTDKKPWKDGGSAAFEITATNKIIFRDLHVYGKAPSDTDTIKAYNNYGSMLLIAGDGEGKKSNVDVIHCVFENSHKVVHMYNAKVYMEGNIIRNASDTALSIGTFGGLAGEFTLKNNIISNSLTGGIVTYCYGDTVTEVNADKSWNKIDIQGFLDIYNWRAADGLSFLPDTELGAGLGDIVNSIVNSEIAPVKKYKELKVTLSDNTQFLHMGIFVINSAKNVKRNEAEVTISDSVGFSFQAFPMPGIAKAFLKQADVHGYFGNNKGDVTVDSRIDEKTLPGLYKDLRDGRK